MPARRIVMIVAAALVLGAAVGGQVSGQAEALLQKAIQAETVDGNLKAAITLYEQAVAAAGSNRPVAARALVQMGQCYEKLGSVEAQKAYQRVVRDFADQAEPLKLARSRLAALTPATARESGIVTRQVWSGPEVDFSGRPSPTAVTCPIHTERGTWQSGNSPRGRRGSLRRTLPCRRRRDGPARPSSRPMAARWSTNGAVGQLRCACLLSMVPRRESCSRRNAIGGLCRATGLRTAAPS